MESASQLNSPVSSRGIASARSRIIKTFTVDDAEFGLFAAWYGKQQQGAEVVNAKNRLIWEKHKRWKRRRLGVRETDNVPGVEQVIENEMSAPDQDFLVWQWYWNGGRTTTAPHLAKVHQIMSQLAGNGSAGASIIVYTHIFDDDIDTARVTLNEFIKAYSPILQRSLNDAITRK
jgi:EpsI family protein